MENVVLFKLYNPGQKLMTIIQVFLRGLGKLIFNSLNGRVLNF